MLKCDLCGRDFKTAQGLAGHKRLAHSEQEAVLGVPADKPMMNVKVLKAKAEALELQGKIDDLEAKRASKVRIPDMAEQSGLGEFAPEVKAQIQAKAFGTPPQAQPDLIAQTQGIIGLITAIKTALMPIPSQNAGQGSPVQIVGADGKPMVMDIATLLQLKRWDLEEKISLDRHGSLMGLVQTVRENLGDGIEAIKQASQGIRAGSGAKKPQPQRQLYECSSCHTQFAIPDIDFERLACPNKDCGVEYTKEQILEAKGG